MKKLSLKFYKELAKAALYDFKRNEGSHAEDLLCELLPNLNDKILKEIKESTINISIFKKEILKELIMIIKSEKFNKSLQKICSDEIFLIKKYDI